MLIIKQIIMPRPHKKRNICFELRSSCFKPRGIPTTSLESVNLSLDELEVMRLSHAEGLYQEDTARIMDISRQTVGRILNSAYRKITDAFLNGKAILIEGGNVEVRCRYFCNNCSYEWETTCLPERPTECPKCNSQLINNLLRCCDFNKNGEV